jgi:hypothetical protein
MTDFATRWNFGKDKFWLHGEWPEELVEFDESLGVWHVYGYPEVAEVLDRPDTYSTDSVRLFNLDEKTLASIDGDLTQMTGAEHAHMRRQVARAFGPKLLSMLETQVLMLANQLLNGLIGRDRFDLLRDFIDDLSGILFTRLLGIPAEDRRFFRLVDQNMDEEAQMTTVQEGADAEYFDNISAPLQPLRDMLGEHIDDRITRSRDDLLSLLAGVRRLDGSRMSRDQIINFVIGMLGAGHLSTPLLIGNTLLCLESHPDQAARIRADRALVPHLLDEVMRYLTPAAATYRATNVDADLGGRRIPKDQLVRVWLGSANRDPRRFAEPNRFDVSRRPNPHLGFGRGAHQCLGEQMILMESRIVFNVLMDRVPLMRIDPDVEPVFFGSPDFTGLRSVSVRTT